MEDLLRRAAQGETGYHKKVSRVYNTNHGISESRTEETDARAGREMLRLQRDLGDQRVAFTKYRNMRTGEERNERDLRGVREDGIDHFERRWGERSATTLSAYPTAHMIGGGPPPASATLSPGSSSRRGLPAPPPAPASQVSAAASHYSSHTQPPSQARQPHGSAHYGGGSQYGGSQQRMSR